MKQRNLFIIGLSVLVLLAAGAFAYQFRSNQILKTQLTEKQEEADSKISSLEEKLARLREGEAMVQPATEFMNEEDLLANFFESTPVMVTPGAEEDVDKNGIKAGPSLLVTPETFDLGQISKAEGPAVATFELKNNGGKPLTISYAFSSCGCTVAPLKEEKILQPGETYPMEVSYDPNFYGPEFELGPIEKTVTILSNYNSRPFYKVKLIANVSP